MVESLNSSLTLLANSSSGMESKLWRALADIENFNKDNHDLHTEAHRRVICIGHAMEC